MRPLGETQIDMLWSLQSHGSWHDCGCGWLWDTPSGTVRILDSLVRRGLVRRQERKIKSYPFLIRTWKILPAGIKAYEQARAERRAKEGTQNAH